MLWLASLGVMFLWQGMCVAAGFMFVIIMGFASPIFAEVPAAGLVVLGAVLVGLLFLLLAGSLGALTIAWSAMRRQLGIGALVCLGLTVLCALVAVGGFVSAGIFA